MQVKRRGGVKRNILKKNLHILFIRGREKVEESRLEIKRTRGNCSLGASREESSLLIGGRGDEGLHGSEKKSEQDCTRGADGGFAPASLLQKTREKRTHKRQNSAEIPLLKENKALLAWETPGRKEFLSKKSKNSWVGWRGRPGSQHANIVPVFKNSPSLTSEKHQSRWGVRKEQGGGTA